MHAARGATVTMEPSAMPLLLLLLLLPAQKAQGSPRAPETRDQLCGRHLLRALVRVCGGPRWSREAAEPATGGEREWGASACNSQGWQGAGLRLLARAHGGMWMGWTAASPDPGIPVFKMSTF